MCHRFNFRLPISCICSKADKKQHALGCIATLMPFKKCTRLMKVFFESQFNYCPLIWMFHPRMMNHKINDIHETALRSVYSDHVFSFGELLKKYRSFSIHHRNIQSLTIELYNLFTVFLLVSWKMSSILTQIFHTTLGHAVNFIVEIQKQKLWNRDYILLNT